jgi:hypothetical protein
VSLPELEAAIQADPELVSIDQQKNAMRVLTDRTNLGQAAASVPSPISSPCGARLIDGNAGSEMIPK